MLISPMGFFAASGGAAAGAYELISTTVLSSTATSVTFADIPQTYKHLQIRMVWNSSNSNNYVRLNGDSASNYYIHYLRGDGSSMASGTFGGTFTSMYAGGSSTGTVANGFGAGVVDILDYASTAKNKTIRNLTGVAATERYIFLNSGLWMNTSAVTSITIHSGTYQIGSRFSIYGIRG